MTNNPYQPFFNELDRITARLTDKNEILDTVDFDKAADLLNRAGFVLANLLSVQAQVYPTLFLEDPEPVQGEVEDTSGTSVE